MHTKPFLRAVGSNSATAQLSTLSPLAQAIVDFVRAYGGTTSVAERERARTDLWYQWHDHRCVCTPWRCAGALLASVPPIVFDCGGKATLPEREAHHAEDFDDLMSAAKSLLWQDWMRDVPHVGRQFHEGLHRLYCEITGLMNGDA